LASTKYDLTSLTWQQFEVLAFKCLQIDISPSIQFNEGGNDKGRDFLFTGTTGFFDNSPHEYVFQAKHKSNNLAFPSLIGDLKTELVKVYLTNKLKYDFYCLVTNLTISGSEFDELSRVFKAFFEENQISPPVQFGIYNYRHFESVIDKTDSLKWLFPSVVSQSEFKLLLKDVVNRSNKDIQEGWLSIFEKNQEKFVFTNIYEEALIKLRLENIILLSGPPKSGKTFTAEMIMFNILFDESFSPYKMDKVDDFDNIYNKEQKQVFLLDDIFGKHDIDIYRADSVDRKFEIIFELIDDNHKCIFTSREYIVRAFSDYSDSELSKLISKIIVDTDKLTLGEKESIFTRYYKLKFPLLDALSDSAIDTIVRNKNFSPETIRSYFEDCTEFRYKDFLQHLDLPDKYLEKVFINLSEERRVTLLSLLFSLQNDERTIAHAFKNLCQDLNKAYLVNLRSELKQLDGSLIRIKNQHYTFYHPSMLDFFVIYLGSDIASYRRILLRNLNLNLLGFIRFSKSKHLKVIILEKEDLPNIIVGLQKIVTNPFATLFEINSILSWLKLPETQLYLKATYKGEYVKFRQAISIAIKSLKLSNFKDEEPYILADFFDFIKLDGGNLYLNETEILDLIKFRKSDKLFWLVVFKLAPFLPDAVVLSEKNNIGKEWLNRFYTELKKEIDELGHELYGSAYPKFEQLDDYKQLISEKKTKEAFALKYKQKSDFKLTTNNQWYPRYKLCKVKMNTLKTSQPLGYKIYERLLDNFQHLTILEDNQKNRYLFNKIKKWWT
jgi:hypothetical protein